ncbi:MAG: S4 domain-containing protein [Gammaproteobacteria bacterium]|nr:S4 domain-containing protein [Gammaproteobacteria bacterium]
MLDTRLDKWLWAARFFKTRTLATEAISGGKVHLNGERSKPSRKVSIGDELEIRHGLVIKTVFVLALADKRGSATVAATLYEETEASIALREAAAEQRRLLAASHPQTDERPNKKQRRQIHRFKNIHDV